jgi:hypothetical protein
MYLSKSVSSTLLHLSRAHYLQADDPDVCKGAIAGEGPIIAHDLREMVIGSHTSQLVCITFFGLCDYPPVTPYTIPFPSPKPAITPPPVSGQPPLKIVHFSDIHIDPFTRLEQITIALNLSAVGLILVPMLQETVHSQRVHTAIRIAMHL